MDTSALKKYAPQARNDFMNAVAQRAAHFGLSARGCADVQFQGDLALIEGRAFTAAEGRLQQKLAGKIAEEGFNAVLDSVAYSWFNRLVAIRYMELHDFLGHGYRILSHPEGKQQPQILEHAEKVQLPGLSRNRVIELKLAGDQDEILYRLLLIAQCNALHEAMPFLFEAVDNESELLLPDKLLHTNSLIRKLVQGIAEEDWQEIEIIGWIYQYYISAKKDEVIGSVVKTEDIPAATQLFTPNWIVKYLLHNSIGRRWLQLWPDSPLRHKMEYYVQTDEPAPGAEAAAPKALEELTLLDPACGSGHILVEAYDLFREMYRERGYRGRDIPRAILANNLFGLDIDERAAQLAAFALIMKARADDPDVLKGGIRMNIRCIRSSDGITAEEVHEALTKEDIVDRSGLPPSDEFEFSEELYAPLLHHLRQQTKGVGGSDEEKGNKKKADLEGFQRIRKILSLFKGEDAATFGSLIRIPEKLSSFLPELVVRTDRIAQGDDIIRKPVAKRFAPIVEQAWILSRHYDAVVANPPYMGSKGLNGTLKAFLRKHYESVKSDLFSAFIMRNCELATPEGQLGFMTPFVWMFIATYKQLREMIIDEKTITSLVQLEYSGFDGATVPICAFTLENRFNAHYKGGYVRLADFRGTDNQAPKTLEAIASPDCGWFYRASARDFKKNPGSPIAYWASEQVRNVFSENVPLEMLGNTHQGLATGKNERFLRLWFEVALHKISFNTKSTTETETIHYKWYPYNKGGEFRRWYGNQDYVVNWENNGYEIRNFFDDQGQLRSRPQNVDTYFKASISWSKISSGFPAFRYFPTGFIYDVAGTSIFAENIGTRNTLLHFCNSIVCQNLLAILSPTLNFEVGHIKSLPVHKNIVAHKFEQALISTSKADWDSYETSWDFSSFPLLRPEFSQRLLKERYEALRHFWMEQTLEMQQLEEENNRLFIEAYGLEAELEPHVPLEEITLTCNPWYRFKGKSAEEVEEEDPETGFPMNQALEKRLLTETMKELVSYVVGCMMGRYSLDEPGLVYAEGGNVNFDASRYRSFPVCEDGMIAVTAFPWFENDGAQGFERFLRAALGTEEEKVLEENLRFVAGGLGAGGGGFREGLRRYFTDDFFKDHVQRYQKRPIYWLFTSGKHKGFQCLVYLHRYHEGTLSRMRTAYVLPLLGHMGRRLEHLEAEREQATGTTQKKGLDREIRILEAQREEVRGFADRLRHAADERIVLDLDDGVLENYRKFEGLVAPF